LVIATDATADGALRRDAGIAVFVADVITVSRSEAVIFE
jgi:hypothetical protein